MDPRENLMDNVLDFHKGNIMWNKNPKNQILQWSEILKFSCLILGEVFKWKKVLITLTETYIPKSILEVELGTVRVN